MVGFESFEITHCCWHIDTVVLVWHGPYCCGWALRLFRILSGKRTMRIWNTHHPGTPPLHTRCLHLRESSLFFLLLLDLKFCFRETIFNKIHSFLRYIFNLLLYRSTWTQPASCDQTQPYELQFQEPNRLPSEFSRRISIFVDIHPVLPSPHRWTTCPTIQRWTCLRARGQAGKEADYLRPQRIIPRSTSQ